MKSITQLIRENPVAAGTIALSLVAALGPARVARLGFWAFTLGARIAILRMSKTR